MAYIPRTPCASLTLTGSKCRRAALQGSDTCQAHTQHPTPPRDPGPVPGKDVEPRTAPRMFTDKMMDQAVALAAAGLGLEGIARTLGVARRTIVRRTSVDPEFAEALETARESAIEFAEQRLYEIGLAGNVQALLGYLKAHKPTKYSEKQAGVNIAIGGQANVAVVGELAPGDQDERIRSLVARLSPERQRALGVHIEDAVIVEDE